MRPTKVKTVRLDGRDAQFCGWRRRGRSASINASRLGTAKICTRYVSEVLVHERKERKGAPRARPSTAVPLLNYPSLPAARGPSLQLPP